jgi:tetratricopeptide (TPR) repeat protein
MKRNLIVFFILTIVGQLNGQTSDEIKKAASARAKAGDYKGAIAMLDKAEVDGKITDYMFVNRAYYKEKIGDLEGAVRDYDKGLETIQYNWGPIITASGVAKYSLGRYEEAIADFTKIIDASREPFFDSYYWRAMSKLKLNDKEGACGDFKVTLSSGNWYEKNYSNEVKMEMFRHCE